MDVNYSNNIFYQGYHDAWVPPFADGAPGALRTSPQIGKGCGAESEGFPDPLCPDMLRFSHNLVGLPHNDSALLFEGNFRPNATAGRTFSFASNLYWSDAPATDLAWLAAV